VQSLIQRYMTQYCKDTGVLSILTVFLNKRFQKTSFLKPFLAKLSYDIVGGKNLSHILPVAVVAELINTSSYQANSALDGKYGVLTRSDKDNQLIASIITREIADKVIEETQFDNELKNSLRSLYSEANSFMYYGQFYELNVLHYKHLDVDKLLLDEYLNLYLTKCDCISGIFSRNVALSGAILATHDQPILNALGNYARNFGIGLNIINDISDYLPLNNYDALPSYKTSVDQYSDMRNGRIFLPVFYALKFGNYEERNKILQVVRNQNTNFTLDMSNELTNILQATKGMQFAFSLAKKYMKEAKKHLHLLPKTIERDFLSIMASSIRTNKFIYNLRRLKASR